MPPIADLRGRGVHDHAADARFWFFSRRLGWVSGSNHIDGRAGPSLGKAQAGIDEQHQLIAYSNTAGVFLPIS